MQVPPRSGADTRSQVLKGRGKKGNNISGYLPTRTRRNRPDMLSPVFPRPRELEASYPRLGEGAPARQPSLGRTTLGTASRPTSFQGGMDGDRPVLYVDLMTSTASVLRSPLERGGTAPLTFSPYDCCAGSAGTGVFAQDTSIAPGTRVPAFFFVLFSAPFRGRTHCPTYGGTQGSCGCPLVRCDGVLVL